MPYTMKIQPVDFNSPECEAVVKPIFKSRFKRLLEKPFSTVLKISAPDKPAGAAAEPPSNCNKGGLEEFEPSSVCLAKMVQNFMEEGGEKQQGRCGRNRCNCFNRNCAESSDEEPDSYNSSLTNACDILKSMVLCVGVSERNLLADTAKIVEKHKINKRKDGFCRKLVADGLIALGYDASICKSKWEKTPSFLAGEYEYVDVIIEDERLIIDIDFRSEFDIARATKAYKLVLQTLPTIFVGKPDRLEKIIGIASEAAKQSLKKKGMPFPPWRKADYVKSKWLSPFTRTAAVSSASTFTNNQESELSGEKAKKSSSHFELILGEKNQIEDGDFVFVFEGDDGGGGDGGGPPAKKWEPPEIKPKNHVNKGVKIVTGLASVIDNKP